MKNNFIFLKYSSCRFNFIADSFFSFSRIYGENIKKNSYIEKPPDSASVLLIIYAREKFIFLRTRFQYFTGYSNRFVIRLNYLLL